MTIIGIKAELLKNEIGAFYNDAVWDRWLEIRLDTQKTISVFDHSEVLSTDLEIGHYYTFLLCPLHSNKTFSIDVATNEMNMDYEGVIQSTSWKPEPRDYELSDRSLFFDWDGAPKEWIVVKFDFGDILLSPRYFTQENINVDIGTKIHLSENVRWDLLAVSL